MTRLWPNQTKNGVFHFPAYLSSFPQSLFYRLAYGCKLNDPMITKWASLLLISFWQLGIVFFSPVLCLKCPRGGISKELVISCAVSPKFLESNLSPPKQVWCGTLSSIPSTIRLIPYGHTVSLSIFSVIVYKGKQKSPCVSVSKNCY